MRPAMTMALLLICAVVVAATRVSAHVGIATDFSEVVTDAALIVRGHVTTVQSGVVAGRGVESVASVSVDAVLKGVADGYVSVAVPGGTVGRYTSRMSGAPTLRVGEHAVFFLKRDATGLWRPVGLTLGVYPINATTDGRAVLNPPIVRGVNADAGRLTRGDTRRRLMSVPEFESLVRLAIAAGAAR